MGHKNLLINEYNLKKIFLFRKRWNCSLKKEYYVKFI